MNSNRDLDEKMLKAIHSGVQTASALAVTLATSGLGDSTSLYRAVDRSLQRLRKAEKIKFVKGKWLIQ